MWYRVEAGFSCAFLLWDEFGSDHVKHQEKNNLFTDWNIVLFLVFEFIIFSL
jgi:hypothetical protein